MTNEITSKRTRRSVPRPGNGGPRANSGGKRPGSGATRRKMMLSEDNADGLRKHLGVAYSGEAAKFLVNQIVANWLAGKQGKE